MFKTKIICIFAEENRKLMNKIGNIVCSPQTKVSEVFNKVKSCEEIDNKLPTMVIGIDNAKNCIKDFSILTKIYEEGKFRWTFKKTERRIDYENDLSVFTNYCYQYIIKDIKYRYVDLIRYDLKRIKKFIKYIQNNNKKYCYKSFNEQFLYIFDKKYNTVYGLSLSLCEYLNIDSIKILKKIFDNKNNIEITKLSFFNENIKYMIHNNQHYIPVFYEYFVG